MADRLLGSSGPIGSQAAVVYPETGSLGRSPGVAYARPITDLSIPDDLDGCSRLVVMVPSAAVQDVWLAQYIWRVASATGAEVLYLSLGKAGSPEDGLRTRLASLSAMTRDGTLPVETRVVDAPSWLEGLEATLRPGDVVLGHAEQRLSTGLFQSRRLIGALAGALPAPVYTLSGFIPKENLAGLRAAPRLIAWGFLALIVAVFLIADDNVIYFLKGSAQQIILFGLLVFEMGLIWLWDAKMG